MFRPDLAGPPVFVASQGAFQAKKCSRFARLLYETELLARCSGGRLAQIPMVLVANRLAGEAAPSCVDPESLARAVPARHGRPVFAEIR